MFHIFRRTHCSRLISPLIRVLVLGLLALATCCDSLSHSDVHPSTGVKVSPHARTQQLVVGKGVTSVLFTEDILPTTEHAAMQMPSKLWLFAGTKRGKIIPFLLSEKVGGANFESKTSIADWEVKKLSELADCGCGTKPYPVYALASASLQQPFQLFCGGGDRFITVWEALGVSGSESGGLFSSANWKIAAQLGPHTGWVKDVAHDARMDLIHSIGCNCIESWTRKVVEDDAIDSSSGRGWQHFRKRAIESSPQAGSTLSSDLLCLCVNDRADCLYAGGVDGRLHVWSTDMSILRPICSVAAHSGRINALVLAEKSGFLFSTGHDGTVQCRDVSSKRTFEIAHVEVAEIKTVDTFGSVDRILAMVCTRDDGDSADVIVGTACGTVKKVRALRRSQDVVELIADDENFVHLEGDPTIHAMCTNVGKKKSKNWLAVGHANGLTLLPLT